MFRSVVPASLRKDQVGKARGEHDHHSVNRAATVEQEMFGPHQNGGGGGGRGGGEREYTYNGRGVGEWGGAGKHK